MSGYENRELIVIQVADVYMPISDCAVCPFAKEIVTADTKTGQVSYVRHCTHIYRKEKHIITFDGHIPNACPLRKYMVFEEIDKNKISKESIESIFLTEEDCPVCGKKLPKRM
jgi:hypothetical protein